MACCNKLRQEGAGKGHAEHCWPHASPKQYTYADSQRVQLTHMWKSNSAICWLSVFWISTVASGPTCSTGCQSEQPQKGVFKLLATLNNHWQLILGGQQQQSVSGRHPSE